MKLLVQKQYLELRFPLIVNIGFKNHTNTEVSEGYFETEFNFDNSVISKATTCYLYLCIFLNSFLKETSQKKVDGQVCIIYKCKAPYHISLTSSLSRVREVDFCWTGSQTTSSADLKLLNIIMLHSATYCTSLFRKGPGPSLSRNSSYYKTKWKHISYV